MSGFFAASRTRRLIVMRDSVRKAVLDLGRLLLIPTPGESPHPSSELVVEAGSVAMKRTEPGRCVALGS
eukprot:scaffold369664_cov52-Prasinocladus_malaysianus.AAC.1